MAEKESNQEEFTLQESRVFPPPAEFAAKAAISGMEAYEKLCAEAASDLSLIHI